LSVPATAICNAGPLISLGKLNRLDLLAGLYNEIQMPEAVYAEVVHFGAARGEPDARIVRGFWRRQGWPVVNVPDEALARVEPAIVLGRGELAVLALGMTLADTDVLLDDAQARREARRLKLRVRGTLGILVQAYRETYLSLSEVEFLIQEIAVRPDIWISAELCRRMLEHLHALTGLAE
jgi:predicted nucleic acid-binding protein